MSHVHVHMSIHVHVHVPCPMCTTLGFGPRSSVGGGRGGPSDVSLRDAAATCAVVWGASLVAPPIGVGPNDF